MKAVIRVPFLTVSNKVFNAFIFRQRKQKRDSRNSREKNVKLSMAYQTEKRLINMLPFLYEHFLEFAELETSFADSLKKFFEEGKHLKFFFNRTMGIYFKDKW